MRGCDMDRELLEHQEANQMTDRQRLEAIISVVCKYLPPDGTPINEAMSEIISYVDPLPPLPVQEPVAYDKTEMNSFVIDLYDEKMKEGKHGHYEIMFHCVHQAIARLNAPAAQRPWQGLTEEDKQTAVWTNGTFGGGALWAEAVLKERNK